VCVCVCVRVCVSLIADEMLIVLIPAADPRFLAADESRRTKRILSLTTSYSEDKKDFLWNSKAQIQSLLVSVINKNNNNEEKTLIMLKMFLFFLQSDATFHFVSNKSICVLFWNFIYKSKHQWVMFVCHISVNIFWGSFSHLHFSNKYHIIGHFFFFAWGQIL